MKDLVFKRIMRMKKVNVAIAIVAYEKYHHDCICSNQPPVGFMGFIEKEYPLYYAELVRKEQGA